MGAFERFADTEVQLWAADASNVVVDRAADELVREPTRGFQAWQLLEHPRRDRLLDGCVESGLPVRFASARSRSSNRGPATAASSSIALVSPERRDHRSLTMS